MSSIFDASQIYETPMASSQDLHATSQSFLDKEDVALQAMKPRAEDVFLAPARVFDGDDFTLPIEPLEAPAELFAPMPTLNEDELALIVEHPSPESSISHAKNMEKGPTSIFNRILRSKKENTPKAASDSEEVFMTMRHLGDQKRRKSGGLFNFLASEEGRGKRAKKKGDGKDLKREYQLVESEDGVWMLVAKEEGPENKERRDSLIDEVEDEG